MIFWLFYEFALIGAEAVFIYNTIKWLNTLKQGYAKQKSVEAEKQKYIARQIARCKTNCISWLAISFAGGFAMIDCFVNYIIK